MNNVFSSGIAAALMIAAPASLAAPAAPPAITFDTIKAAGDKTWDRMDANHDGKIDRADHDAHLLERFAHWDTNHDGVIGKDEFLAFAHAREAKWHERHGDGAPPPPPPPPPGPDHGHGSGYDGIPFPPGYRWHHGRMRQHPGGMVAMALVRAALRDARTDGVVMRPAFDTALKARFDKVDTNHDGTLTRDEMRAAMHEWHSGPRHPGGKPPPPSCA